MLSLPLWSQNRRIRPVTMGRSNRKRQAGAAIGSARFVLRRGGRPAGISRRHPHHAATNPTHVTAAAIPGSATTPQLPPTQAAKKARIEPRLTPVPPAESPVDGAGPQRGRKDGPPDSYLEPPNPLNSPFFFGFQKPFFFQQGKRNGLWAVSPVLSRHKKQWAEIRVGV